MKTGKKIKASDLLKTSKSVCKRGFCAYQNRLYLFILIIEAEGKSVEEEINKKGLPGKAMFIFCDVTKENDVKVSIQNNYKEIKWERALRSFPPNSLINCNICSMTYL